MVQGDKADEEFIQSTSNLAAVKMFHIIAPVSIFLLHFVGPSHCIVGGRQAAEPPRDDPVVFIQHAERFARVEGVRSLATEIYSFRGIRYADPPVGAYRFRRPRFLRPVGDINATMNGPPCPQPDPMNPASVIGREDCLILNIFSPQMPVDKEVGLPVIFFIHPGGFRYGSAAQYGAEPVVQNGVVFVVPQYRLGTLGLYGDGSKSSTSNLAMLDLETALRWVKEYISFFGGNPNKITPMGHGSGAAAAQYISMTPQGRSGLNGMILMSGTALSPHMYDETPTRSMDEIAAINECSSAVDDSDADAGNNEQDQARDGVEGQNQGRDLGQSQDHDEAHLEQGTDREQSSRNVDRRKRQGEGLAGAQSEEDLKRRGLRKVLSCLRSRDVATLVFSDSKAQDARMKEDPLRGATGMAGFSPTFEAADDYRSLPGLVTFNPATQLDQGNFPAVPVLAGVSKDETAWLFTDEMLSTISQSPEAFLRSIQAALTITNVASALQDVSLKNSSSLNMASIRDAGIKVANIGDAAFATLLNGLKSSVGNAAKLFEEVISLTTDAFFNLPVHQTLSKWSNRAPAYLYRFEYAGKTNIGKSLLKGLPIVSSTKGGQSDNEDDSGSRNISTSGGNNVNTANAPVAYHGNELGYLFRIYDIHGNKIRGSKVSIASCRFAQQCRLHYIASTRARLAEQRVVV